MTLSELQSSTKDFLSPKDVADLIGCMPYSINVQAQTDPSKLGFPVSLIGTRVRIPRLGFLYWMTHGTPIIQQDDLFRRRDENALKQHDAD